MSRKSLVTFTALQGITTPYKDLRRPHEGKGQCDLGPYHFIGLSTLSAKLSAKSFDRKKKFTLVSVLEYMRKVLEMNTCTTQKLYLCLFLNNENKISIFCTCFYQ